MDAESARQTAKNQSVKPRRVRGEARKALAAAAKLARVPKGTELKLRKQAIERAIDAFASCAERFAKSALVVAESEFRRLLEQQAARLPGLRRLQDFLPALRRQAIELEHEFRQRIDQRQAHQEKAQQDELEERAWVIHAKAGSL